MPLDNFFKINFPYGIQVNDKDEWTAFNREYKPLGYTDTNIIVTDKDFKYYKYKNLTISKLKKLCDKDGFVEKKGDKIIRVFLYGDESNPSNFDKKELYNRYFAKLEILSKLKKA